MCIFILCACSPGCLKVLWLQENKREQLSINFQVCSLLSYITVIFLLMVLVAGDKQLPVPRGKRGVRRV